MLFLKGLRVGNCNRWPSEERVTGGEAEVQKGDRKGICWLISTALHKSFVFGRKFGCLVILGVWMVEWLEPMSLTSVIPNRNQGLLCVPRLDRSHFNSRGFHRVLRFSYLNKVNLSPGTMVFLPQQSQPFSWYYGFPTSTKSTFLPRFESSSQIWP